VIGPLKANHRTDRNYLKGREGDRANAVLAAAGYNFSVLALLEDLLRALLPLVVWRVVAPTPMLLGHLMVR
jgi:transposase, IS5 family